MTISKPTDIREFWITEDMESVKFERGATAGMAFDHKQSDDEEYVHVIEYRAVEQLKAENTEIKSLMSVQLDMHEQIKKLESENKKLNEIISYMPKVPTQPYEKQLAKDNLKLREKVKDYEGALENWIDFENESIKKDGPYVGEKINKIILQAREVLKKWSGV